MRARTLQAVQSEGHSGHGEITILLDGAEIMKRLQTALTKPATHIINLGSSWEAMARAG